MADDWLPGWEQIEGNDSGAWSPGTLRPKLLLHTTEGATIEGAVAAYEKKDSWPHVTADPVRRRRAHHVPLDRPARALRNTGVPGETNRSPRVIQVEIVGFAATTPDWGDDLLDWLGVDVVRVLCLEASIPMTTGLTFYGLDAGFTLASSDAPQRLSRQQWESYSGVLGHQHAPENTHWDPGALNVERILSAARGAVPPTPGGPFMALTDAQQQRLLALAEAQALQATAIEQRVTRIEAALNIDDKGVQGHDGKDPYPVRGILSLTKVEKALRRIESHLGISKSK